ncbi:MAG: Gfo/Idh/MocA family oxidoreductase [Verrucomicrobiae bacterium]|nr:Gfo/Idh/MocA family oxidoreductase [Verrucomicrobiae bacterium]
MKVAVVGCGLIGKKRVNALGADHALVAAVDKDLARAQALAAMRPGAVATANWREVVRHPDVEAVIVATTNDSLAPVTLEAIRAGKHVLVEKPAARSPDELVPVLAASERAGVHVQVGFNHRFHPAFLKARAIVDSEALGPLMFLRARYGHGGRVGYDREWRADPKVAGGGELLDQGVHLIDLSRWFLGDFVRQEGWVHTWFWDMPVEDNGFLLLRTKEDRAAWLHASCTEWKNLFSFELYGRVGKLHVEGLGGSYGVERLTFYRMKPEMGPPDNETWEFPGEDTSWRAEFESFARKIATGEGGVPTLGDAKAALEIVAKAYEQSGKSENRKIEKSEKR